MPVLPRAGDMSPLSEYSDLCGLSNMITIFLLCSAEDLYILSPAQKNL